MPCLAQPSERKEEIKKSERRGTKEKKVLTTDNPRKE
jgi:hypothetical protein